MPMNSKRGNSSLAMPASNSTDKGPSVPPCVMAPDSGRFTRIAPKPMGSSRLGSIFLTMARYMRMQPTAHITACPAVTDVKGSNNAFIAPPLKGNSFRSECSSSVYAMRAGEEKIKEYIYIDK